MMLTIDNLDSITSWTNSDITKMKVAGTNQIPAYIANENDYSLMIQCIGDASGEYVQKTFTAIDISSYDEIVMWIYSTRLKNQGGQLTSYSDFKYSIDFNSTMTDFCIPTYNSFTPVVFDVRDLTTIDRIRITALHDESDYLFISSIIAYKDQIPLDIYKSFKTKVENRLTDMIGDGVSIGSTVVSDGDTELKITGNKDYINKYSVVRIKDITNSEDHQLDENDESYYKINSMYDGDEIINDFAAGTVYLRIPVEYGMNREVLIPGIMIKGWQPTVVNRHNKQTKELYSYRADQTVNERKNPEIMNWNIEFHLEARHEQIMQIMSDAVRQSIESELLWINGKRYQVNFQGDPAVIDPIMPEDLVYKKVYTCIVEIQEYFDEGITLPNTTTLTNNIYVEAN